MSWRLRTEWILDRKPQIAEFTLVRIAGVASQTSYIVDAQTFVEIFNDAFFFSTAL